MSEFKKLISSGLIFTFLEKVGAQGISFIVSIVLARLLLPSEYGVLAIALIFVQLCDVIVTYGFSNSLIVKQDSDDIDFSTCFYFSIIVSIVLYCIVFVSANYIQTFFNLVPLADVLKVLALRLPIVAINSVQQAYVSKELKFKLFFYGTLAGVLCSGIIGITFALMGYGVWALVFQSLSNSIITTITLWFLVKWRPIKKFSLLRLKFIYSYGWKILATGLIDSLYSQIRNLVIGKKYSPSELAYYNRGMQFPTLGINIIEPTLSNVMFPALSKKNDSEETMVQLMRKMIQLSTYLVFPFFVILACCARSLIIVLLTDKWLDSVMFLQLGCLALFIRPIQVINSTLIRASCRSGLLLKLDILKKAIGLALLGFSIPLGIKAIVWSLIVTNFISTIINIIPNKRIYNYGFKQQISDVLPNLVLSIIVGTILFLYQLIFDLNSYWMLSIQILSGILFVLLFSIIMKIESFNYFINMIKPYLAKTLKF